MKEKRAFFLVRTDVQNGVKLSVRKRERERERGGDCRRGSVTGEETSFRGNQSIFPVRLESLSSFHFKKGETKKERKKVAGSI